MIRKEKVETISTKNENPVDEINWSLKTYCKVLVLPLAECIALGSARPSLS